MNRLIAGQQARIEELEAEITRLRAALETARRDALEEAAKRLDVEYRFWNRVNNRDEANRVAECAHLIRALIQPNTSPS